ncbi:hypothetical protein AA3266_1797 [Gluconobacter kondonii NBRC 3266]|nr:hypothetical protein AA3266_1797 [Gluconobacter kondonii NBRC 3266]
MQMGRLQQIPRIGNFRGERCGLKALSKGIKAVGRVSGPGWADGLTTIGLGYDIRPENECVGRIVDHADPRRFHTGTDERVRHQSRNLRVRTVDRGVNSARIAQFGERGIERTVCVGGIKRNAMLVDAQKKRRRRARRTRAAEGASGQRQCEKGEERVSHS